jgi:hypothetical protein
MNWTHSEVMILPAFAFRSRERVSLAPLRGAMRHVWRPSTVAKMEAE